MVPLQEQGQHDVGLLEYLEPVDHQRVVMQQQRTLVVGGVREVPQLPGEELVVLRMDAKGVIERDDHSCGTFLPTTDLVLGEVQFGAQMLKPQRVLILHPPHDAGCVNEVRPRHDIGVEVVVDDRGVLVGPGHAMNVEFPASVDPPEAQICPHPRRLDEDRSGIAEEEGLVPRRTSVVHDRVSDVSIDVILSRTCGVVGGGLLTSDRPPREESSPLGQFFGSSSGLWKSVDPEPQGVLSDSRMGVGQHRDDVDLGVPEVVAFIARSGHTLGRDTQLVSAGRGLSNLEEVPPHRLLDAGRRAFNLDVSRRPIVVEPLSLLVVVDPMALLADSVEAATNTVEQFVHRHPSRGVIGHGLVHSDGATLGGLDAVNPFATPGLGVDEGDALVVGGDLVISAHRQGHRGPGRVEPQDHPPVRVPVLLRDEHLVGKLAGLTRIVGIPRVLRTNVILVHAVLTIEDLRADDDGGIPLEHRHLDAHESHVTVGEGHHP